jgi:hypothetical protein
MESRLFPSEFLLILVWVLLPALVLGLVALFAYRVRAGANVLRTVQAGTVMTSLSFALCMVFVLYGPAGLPRWLGLRDSPVVWAPFAFVAVLLALLPSIWWMRFGIASKNERQR